MSLKKNQGQIILIMIFSLTFALFSVFVLMMPIRDKLLRIKDLESIYQAIANSEKGLEASLLYIMTTENLSLDIQEVSDPPVNCGGLNKNGPNAGKCYQITLKPITSDSLWKDNVIFIANEFKFVTSSSVLSKTISDGYQWRNVRTIFIGNAD